VPETGSPDPVARRSAAATRLCDAVPAAVPPVWVPKLWNILMKFAMNSGGGRPGGVGGAPSEVEVNSPACSVTDPPLESTLAKP
jgi:hypothetical protein